MANLIQKAKRKTPELTVIKWDGDIMSTYEIKSMLGKNRVGVFYIGPDDWHDTMTLGEQQGLVYYDPYLVISAGRNDIRFEKDQYLVLNPEACGLEPRVTIMSEEELRENYDLCETKEESEDYVLDEQDPHEDGPVLHEPVPEKSPEEEVDDDNAQNDDQADGSDHRAVEDLAGHGDGELRERDALGGESGEPDHEGEADV